MSVKREADLVIRIVKEDADQDLVHMVVVVALEAEIAEEDPEVGIVMDDQEVEIIIEDQEVVRDEGMIVLDEMNIFRLKREIRGLFFVCNLRQEYKQEILKIFSHRLEKLKKLDLSWIIAADVTRVLPTLNSKVLIVLGRLLHLLELD